MSNDATNSTTDIVQRLRECAEQCDRPTSDLYNLAADEIGQLRCMVEFQRTANAAMEQQWERWRQKVMELQGYA